MRPSGIDSSRRGFREDGKMAISDILCLHCGACVGSCPVNSIFMHEAYNTFDDSCTQCGICVRVCGVGAIDYPMGHKLATHG